ncbi:hypothetical protein C8R44DRAFT_740595 [Mycena epipterygia]|nr:hypothetical protein C8R44DRAFT_740595 [Mycena epipterygia]
MEEVEEEVIPRVHAPLTNTPHILELLPMNARSPSPETLSRTSSPGIYVPNTDSTAVLGKRRANPADEHSPSPTGSRSQSPELYLPNTRPVPHGAGSSRPVDTTTAARSLLTPEDLFHSLREPSTPASFITSASLLTLSEVPATRPTPVPGFVDVQRSMFNSPSFTEMNIKLPIVSPVTQSTEGDGSTYLSCYLLNKSYELVGHGRSQDDPVPGFILWFVSTYKHFTIKRLKDIAKAHRLPSSERRASLLMLLQQHTCTPTESDIFGLQKWLAPARNGLFRAGAWIWVGSPAHARPIGLQATLMAWQAIPPTSPQPKKICGLST